MNERPQHGFTMVELVITMAILSTVMAAVWSAAVTVNTTAATNSRSAESMTAVRRTLNRISGFIRPGKLSTIQVTAKQEDVTLGLAATVGEWIFPPVVVVRADEWRPGIKFVSASGALSPSGVPSMNAALSTSPRELTFSLDAGETANGVDDDGDGLIDEGSLRLLHDNVTVAVVTDIEECSFILDGRMLGIRLRCGATDGRGRVYRAQAEQNFYLRNN